mmetsp:Transcript_16554/g.40757  ORF Transcript_16554/g.40757 Transcript_16554/m.40757 type:complete len:449 (+) Transcript_16554:366-1712(+)
MRWTPALGTRVTRMPSSPSPPPLPSPLRMRTAPPLPATLPSTGAVMAAAVAAAAATPFLPDLYRTRLSRLYPAWRSALSMAVTSSKVSQYMSYRSSSQGIISSTAHPGSSRCVQSANLHAPCARLARRISGKQSPSFATVRVVSDGYPNPGVSARSAPDLSGSNVTWRVVCRPRPSLADTALTDCNSRPLRLMAPRAPPPPPEMSTSVMYIARLWAPSSSSSLLSAAPSSSPSSTSSTFSLSSSASASAAASISPASKSASASREPALNLLMRLLFPTPLGPANTVTPPARAASLAFSSSDCVTVTRGFPCVCPAPSSSSDGSAVVDPRVRAPSSRPSSSLASKPSSSAYSSVSSSSSSSSRRSSLMPRANSASSSSIPSPVATLTNRGRYPHWPSLASQSARTSSVTKSHLLSTSVKGTPVASIDTKKRVSCLASKGGRSSANTSKA